MTRATRPSSRNRSAHAFTTAPGSGNTAGRVDSRRAGDQGAAGARSDQGGRAAARGAAASRRGTAAGPTLVFLHEGLGSIAHMARLPDAAMRAAGPAGPRLRPLGPRPVGAARRGRARRRTCTTRPSCSCRRCSMRSGIERPILIGHSDGGTIALLFAAALPGAAAAAVVTEAAHVFVEDSTLAGIRAAVRRLCARRTCAPRLARYHGDKTDSLFPGLARLLAGARVPRLEHRGRAAARHLPRPGPAGRGRRVRHAGAGRGDRRAASAARSRRVLLPGCGHTPHQQAAGRGARPDGRVSCGRQLGLDPARPGPRPRLRNAPRLFGVELSMR